MSLDTEKEPYMLKETKDRINKRKIAYIYLMHRMFEGNPMKMKKIMGFSEIAVADLQDWDADYKEAVYQTIQEEDLKGVQLRGRDDVPSIKSIKEKVLRRVDQIIQETTDPSRLATTYKILSEFEVADDKKEKSVLDAINESIKPLSPKKKETVTMLDKMRNENMLTTFPGKKRGRPRKVQAESVEEPEVDSQEVNDDEPGTIDNEE